MNRVMLHKLTRQWHKFWGRVELLTRAGIPDSVFNLLLGGADLGGHITRNSTVDGVFFTGGAIAGKAIRIACAEDNKACAIEAGGNSVIVVDTCNDVKKAVEIAVQSTLWSAGQRCNCARHLFVTKAAEKKGFLKEFLSEVSKIKPAGKSTDEDAFYGVFRKSDDKQRIIKHVKTQIKNGAEIIAGSIEAQEKFSANAVSPIVLLVDPSAPINQEEHMGPVITVHMVPDLDAAISKANKVQHRLSAGLITANSEDMKIFEQNMKFGNLTLNCPTAFASGYASFGGLGDSGNYRPAGYLAIDFCVTGISRFKVNNAIS